MKFEFNPYYSLLAIVVNVGLVFVLNAEVDLLPPSLPDSAVLSVIGPALLVQLVISSVMPGFVGPMAREAGLQVGASLPRALLQGSVYSGAIVATVGAALHYVANTPNYTDTIIGITLMTVVPCACLVLLLRYVPSARHSRVFERF